MGFKEDLQTKANLDRIDSRKANRVRMVEALPARGRAGDMVVMKEEVSGEQINRAYFWVEGAWARIGG